MTAAMDYDELDSTLRRCGSSWNAGQAHGMLCGQLSVLGVKGGGEWLQLVLDDNSQNGRQSADCVEILDGLYLSTYRQLAERLSEFAPLLPEDSAELSSRAKAMGQWCEGFLHGLVSTSGDDVLRRRLAAEPLSEIIKDLLQITRVTTEVGSEQDVEDEAYEELYEYLRIVAQLVFEELAEFRDPPSRDPGNGTTDQVLH